MILSKAATAASLGAIGSLCEGATLSIYGGAPPPTADDPITDYHVGLVYWRFGSPAFHDTKTGMVANFLKDSVTPLGSGYATFARIANERGVVVADLTLGLRGDPTADLCLDHLQIDSSIVLTAEPFMIKVEGSCP